MSNTSEWIPGIPPYDRADRPVWFLTREGEVHMGYLRGEHTLRCIEVQQPAWRRWAAGDRKRPAPVMDPLVPWLRLNNGSDAPLSEYAIIIRAYMEIKRPPAPAREVTL